MISLFFASSSAFAGSASDVGDDDCDCDVDGGGSDEEASLLASVVVEYRRGTALVIRKGIARFVEVRRF